MVRPPERNSELAEVLKAPVPVPEITVVPASCMEPPVQLSEPFTVRVPVPPMAPAERLSAPEEATLAPVSTFTVPPFTVTPPEPAPDREAPEPRVQTPPSNDKV